ncbi:MAG TPA: tannase/feruloyl esterase family alpha/beta hydrolase, partial [Pseudolabrys sp.]|nr:tannase/feruloyl esterase family alpha/beta hydrolase [Pseudolabrys sp.]
MRNHLAATWPRAAATVGAACTALFCTGALAATPCSDLVSLRLPDARVTSAITLSGDVVGPDGNNYTGLPSFCSVTIVATPTSDSLINYLMWLPDNTWNGRFEATGNGGYGGNMAIDAFAMVYGVKHGFAVIATDMGTAPSSNNDADTLIGHPEKWIDWGTRSTHLMTILGKKVLQAFQSSAPRYSYFNGCSTGGQQALLNAQRYPNDYDGILAGAPAHDRTHVHTAVEWLFRQTHRNASSYITPDKVTLISNAIMAACVAKSGGAPGDTWLTDPRKCDWKPSELRCTSPGQTDCLNDDQLHAATAIYNGPRDPVTKRQIFPGNPKGAEGSSSFGWNANQAGVEPNFGSLFKWVFGPTWTYRNFDFHNDMHDLDRVLAPLLNVMSPDLSRFRNNGGKLLMYHGFADPLISPYSSIDYYTNVVKLENGGVFDPTSTQDYFRLFMVPGMNHCFGGPGPHVFGNEYS